MMSDNTTAAKLFRPDDRVLKGKEDDLAVHLWPRRLLLPQCTAEDTGQKDPGQSFESFQGFHDK